MAAKRVQVKVTGHKKFSRRTGFYEGDIRIDTSIHLDEIVVDEWLHVEAMNDNEYWCRLGEKTFSVIRSGKKWAVSD